MGATDETFWKSQRRREGEQEDCAAGTLTQGRNALVRVSSAKLLADHGGGVCLQCLISRSPIQVVETHKIICYPSKIVISLFLVEAAVNW
jgi:hypothetical protein